MDIILDEKKKVEEILKNKSFGKDKEKGKNRILLIKYYKSIGMTKKMIKASMYDFIKKYDKDLDMSDFKTKNYIDKIVDRFAKGKYYLNKKIIYISEKELEAIKEFNNDSLEYLAFIMMIYAKIGGKNWANMEISELFKHANIILNKKKQDILLSKLYEKKYMELSNRCNNLNFKLKKIDENCEKYPVIIIEDTLKDVLLYYKKWKGENIKTCRNCGRLIERVNNKIVYCKECAKEINLENIRELNKNRRKRKK